MEDARYAAALKILDDFNRGIIKSRQAAVDEILKLPCPRCGGAGREVEIRLDTSLSPAPPVTPIGSPVGCPECLAGPRDKHAPNCRYMYVCVMCGRDLRAGPHLSMCPNKSWRP